jgi:hypothetical protein
MNQFERNIFFFVSGGLELVVRRTLPLRSQPDYGQVLLLVSSGDKGVTVMIRTFLPRAHITVTIDYDQEKFEGKPAMDYKGISELEATMAEALLGVKTTCTIPELKRALESDIYFTTTDFRVLEYDFVQMLFDEKSDFQHVQVARSINYGNVLILDGLVNMADSDMAYTETIMARGEVDYAGKDVLILGGGDGGLLHELEKTRANSVTMIEIDEVVIKACKKYLRGVCGDSLDKYKVIYYCLFSSLTISLKEIARLIKFLFCFCRETNTRSSSVIAFPLWKCARRKGARLM